MTMGVVAADCSCKRDLGGSSKMGCMMMKKVLVPEHNSLLPNSELQHKLSTPLSDVHYAHRSDNIESSVLPKAKLDCFVTKFEPSDD